MLWTSPLRGVVGASKFYCILVGSVGRKSCRFFFCKLLSNITWLTNVYPLLRLLCFNPTSARLLLHPNSNLPLRLQRQNKIIFVWIGKLKNLVFIFLLDLLYLSLQLRINLLQMIILFAFLLICYSDRFNLVLDGLVVETCRFDFALHFFYLSFESEAFFFEKSELFSQLHDMFVSFNLNIYISVGLLS